VTSQDLRRERAWPGPCRSDARCRATPWHGLTVDPLGLYSHSGHCLSISRRSARER
jgi:hypothetical protein